MNIKEVSLLYSSRAWDSRFGTAGGWTTKQQIRNPCGSGLNYILLRGEDSLFLYLYNVINRLQGEKRIEITHTFNRVRMICLITKENGSADTIGLGREGIMEYNNSYYLIDFGLLKELIKYLPDKGNYAKSSIKEFIKENEIGD